MDDHHHIQNETLKQFFDNSPHPPTMTYPNLKADTSLAKGCRTTVRTNVGGESALFNSQAILGDNTSGNLKKFNQKVDELVGKVPTL